MAYMLCGLQEITAKDKKYYKAVVLDNDCNISDIFTTEQKFNQLKNYMYKDISNIIKLQYIRDIKGYKLAIDSDK